MAQKLILAGRVVRNKKGETRLVVGPLRKRRTDMVPIRVVEHPDAARLNLEQR